MLKEDTKVSPLFDGFPAVLTGTRARPSVHLFAPAARTARSVYLLRYAASQTVPPDCRLRPPEVAAVMGAQGPIVSTIRPQFL